MLHTRTVSLQSVTVVSVSLVYLKVKFAYKRVKPYEFSDNVSALSYVTLQAKV